MRCFLLAVGIAVLILLLWGGTPRVIRQFTNVGVDSTFALDSLGANAGYNLAGRAYIFSKGKNSVHVTYSDGTTHNLDSAGTSGVSVVSHAFVKKWSLVGALPDSQFVINLPAAVTLDSIAAFQIGASAMTVNAYRNRGGTVVAFFSSNYTMTTTLTTIPSIQNAGALNANDQFWAVIKTMTGSPTQVNMEFYCHGTQ